MPIGKNKSVVKWSVYITTELFKGQEKADGDRAMRTGVKPTLARIGFEYYMKDWNTGWPKEFDGSIVEVSQGHRDEA